MKQGFVVGAIVLAVGAGALLHAQSARSADVQMKAAQQQAEVEGDLKGAIEAYKKIVANAASNRARAAEALVRMAECYQKLGDAESRKIYERIVHEYADQKNAAATAQARLLGAATAQNAGITPRRVWAGPNVDTYGSVSPDGRFIAFTDWNTGDLAVHDLTTGQDRRLTGKKDWNDPAFAMGAVISRDGRQIAYGWSVVSPIVPTAKHLHEVRIIDTAGGTPRVLFTARDLTGAYVHDWSPDGRWLAVELSRADHGAQIALVSVDDGSLRVLKSIDPRGSFKIAFSPDGRSVAYDASVDTDSEQHQIHLIGVDGSHDTPALTHPANDRVLGWSSDGQLLFASDRGGATGIWALPKSDGKPQADARLIKANVTPSPLGLTRSGVLHYGLTASTPEIYVASADFETGKVLSPPTVIPRPYAGLIGFPQWSPDGRSLAYLTRRDSNSRASQMTALLIRSMDTGKVRQLDPDLPYLNAFNTPPLWAPDGSFLVVTAVDKNGRHGIYRIDAQRGTSVPLLIEQNRDEFVVARAISRDGATLFITRRDLKSQEGILVARTLSSGGEREIARRTGDWGRGMDLSPDGRTLAVGIRDAAAKATTLVLVPVNGGEPRELLRVSAPEAIIGSLAKWSANGTSILFVKDKGDGFPRELWSIAATGGPARKLSVNAEWVPSLAVNGRVGTSFHPDGHQVAFVVGESRLEIWALDVLSASSSKK